jgi:hypothetical protein
VLVALAWCSLTGIGWAQPERPISLFVADVRGAFPFYPDNDEVAAARDLTADLLPGYGVGVDVGAHVYPLRWKLVTFGAGATLLLSRGGRTPEVPEGSSTPALNVSARLRAFSPQLSFNFGHRMGWSYISGGLGAATFRAWREDQDEEEGEATKTINYGGGARWFIREHVAFAVDVRFYAMNPKDPSATTAGHPRMTLAVLSAGLAFR